MRSSEGLAGGAGKIRGFNMDGMLNPFDFWGSGLGGNPMESNQNPTEEEPVAAAIFPRFF